MEEREEENFPTPRSDSSMGSAWGADVSQELRDEMTGILEKRLADVQRMASHSKNLKGTFVHALQDAVVVRSSATRELNMRAQSHWQAEALRGANNPQETSGDDDRNREAEGERRLPYAVGGRGEGVLLSPRVLPPGGRVEPG